jgi:hypothetical protein
MQHIPRFPLASVRQGACGVRHGIGSPDQEEVSGGGMSRLAGQRDAGSTATIDPAMPACAGRDKGLFASFSSENEESSFFEKKRAKKLLFSAHLNRDRDQETIDGPPSKQ